MSRRDPASAPQAELLTNDVPMVRCVFVAGRGGHGKSLLLRWMAERAFAAGRTLVIADGDRTNRTLPQYFEGVVSPASVDEAAVARWLETLLERMVTDRFNLLVDLGGGDQVLKRLAAEVALQSLLEENGVAPVMLHLPGPEVESLGYLAAVETPNPGDPDGAPLFAPTRTALVLNEGLIADPNLDPAVLFQPVRDHKVFQAALRRGAVPVIMPRLMPAIEVNRRHLSFADAAGGKTEGTLPPLGLGDRQRVKLWQRAMEANFAAVQEWLP